MKAKHTEAPWFVHDFTDIGGTVTVSCAHPDHITVAMTGRALTATHEEALANARLIAAAPDLLAENQRLRAILTELIESAEYWSEYDVPIGIVDRMREALKEEV